MATEKPTCVVPSCAREARTRGMCGMHHQRFLRHGDPEVRVRAAKVSNADKLKWIESLPSGSDEGGCIKWPFSVAAHGRGVVRYRGKLTSAPHAVALHFHGDPPSGANEAAHSCGNGHLGCVRPAHLSWATRAENEADKVAHGTVRRGEKINTTRLDAGDVVAIRASRERGTDLARQYGVSESEISAIRQRHTWAWLPD